MLAPKYAVLLGLLDVLMERTSAKGEPPSVVTTRELAEKVTELYWPQADASADTCAAGTGAAAPR